MKKQVYAYLHTHWDREWYRDKEDFNIRLLEITDIILDELKSGKAPFFYFDGQVIALLDYLKYRKDKQKQIVNLIKNKKLAIGPYFASIDSYLASFPTLLKNLELGLKISKEYSQVDFIGYMADIFGISKSVFDALKLKNIDKAIIWRGVNPEKIGNNCNFIKNNIKTTWLVQGYFNDFFHSSLPLDKKVSNIKNYLDKINKYSPSCCLLPIGADHLGILKDAENKIKEINKYLDDYEIILTSPFEYFKNNKYSNITKEQEFLDNSNTYILQGVYSTRIRQKIKNADIQNKLERRIVPLNYYLKDNYCENIDFVYKTLIKNHAHDGIYGCSVDSTARAVDSRFEKCENAISAIEKKLLGNFKKKHNITGKSKDKVGIFNLSNFDNINKVKVSLPYILPNAQITDKYEGFCDELLYDIYKIPVTEDITKIYTQLIEIDKNKKFEFNTVKIKKPSKKVIVSSDSIENDDLCLFVKNGKIYVLNKKTNKKIELKLTDIKDKGDTYNFAPEGEYKNIELKNTKIIYDGNIESKLRLIFDGIELDAVLSNNSKYIHFYSKINNKKKNHKLQLCVLFDEYIKKTTASDAIGIIERKTNPDYRMQDFMPAKRPYELKTNCYPMQNFVQTQGTILVTKGLHEYEIYKNTLRVCLLRAVGTISNPKNPSRFIPAGPDLKTPEAQCQGVINAEFGISFGNVKKAFFVLDEFLENYYVLDGEYKENINIVLDTISDNSYIYGISEGKKISYNILNNEIKLI